MEESYETFEEDLASQKADLPPQRPSRPIRRPEYASRKLKEEVASAPLQIKAEPKIFVREPSFSRSTSSMPQTISTQNASHPEVPWESVTLNRCLFIAITILVLTSGFQRLHEALHGHKVTLDEDQYGMIMRRSGALRHRPETEATFLEVILSWLPDLDDDDDDDEDNEDEVRLRKRKPKRQRFVKTLRSLRNRPLPDKLLKQRGGQSNVRPAKKLVDKNEDLGEKANDQDNMENTERESKKRPLGKKPRTIID